MRNTFLFGLFLLFISCKRTKEYPNNTVPFINVNKIILDYIQQNFSDSITKVAIYKSYTDTININKKDLLDHRKLFQFKISPQKWATDFIQVPHQGTSTKDIIHLRSNQTNERVKEIKIEFSEQLPTTIFIDANENDFLTSNRRMIFIEEKEINFTTNFEIKPINKEKIVLKFISKP